MQRLVDDGVADLAGISDDMRGDGLPQNWVDDCVNTDAAQKADLRGIVVGQPQQWCQSLHNHLIV